MVITSEVVWLLPRARTSSINECYLYNFSTCPRNRNFGRQNNKNITLICFLTQVGIKWAFTALKCIFHSHSFVLWAISRALRQLMFTFGLPVSFWSSELSFIHFRHFPVSYCFPLCYHSIICFLHDRNVGIFRSERVLFCSCFVFIRDYYDGFPNNCYPDRYELFAVC